jgi:hypothetical protein
MQTSCREFHYISFQSPYTPARTSCSPSKPKPFTATPFFIQYNDITPRPNPNTLPSNHPPHRLLTAPLFFNGESPTLLPLQNTQTKTLGNHSFFSPTQPMCSHLRQASHCTMSVFSSSTKPSQIQRVLSLLLLLHSVEGVVVVVGEPLKELE